MLASAAGFDSSCGSPVVLGRKAWTITHLAFFFCRRELTLCAVVARSPRWPSSDLEAVSRSEMVFSCCTNCLPMKSTAGKTSRTDCRTVIALRMCIQSMPWRHDFSAVFRFLCQV